MILESFKKTFNMSNILEGKNFDKFKIIVISDDLYDDVV